MPFFSVIIPAYNRADLIGQTLDSVLAQSFRDFEIIVVDDGSTDNTVEALSAYAGRIKLLRQENQGPSAARNHGLRHAAGEYVAFLDSDDLWFPWTLATFKQAIDAHNRPSLIIGTPFRFNDPRQLAAVEKGGFEADHYADYLASSDQFIVSGTGFMVFSPKAMSDAGGLLESMTHFEDIDLLIRMGLCRDSFTCVRPRRSRAEATNKT